MIICDEEVAISKQMDEIEIMLGQRDNDPVQVDITYQVQENGLH
jgi:hypothetical protein